MKPSQGAHIGTAMNSPVFTKESCRDPTIRPLKIFTQMAEIGQCHYPRSVPRQRLLVLEPS